MTEPTSGESPSTKLYIAIAIVILLWVGYTVLQTAAVIGHIGDGWSAALGILPGLLGVAVLRSAGKKREECYLTVNPISLPGLAVLAGVFVFALSAMLPIMVWRGWSWTAALILAPAGGISQELFFRSSLLPAFQSLLGRRHRLALIGHSVLFGLWHIGPLFVGAPIWAVIAVMLVPFLSGIGWGWQVMRDRTVYWAMIQHSLIWVIGLQFAVPG
jgi:membrane protease YdiL (CAAX protease family)